MLVVAGSCHPRRRTVVIAALTLSLALAAPVNAPAPGATVPKLTLKDIHRRPRVLDGFKDRKALVIVFVGTECPLANLYIPTLIELHKEYARQASRILQKRCQECHRPGEIGPMALLNYKDAKGWADTIQEVVLEQRMPPWHADPRHGKFSNHRRLSQEETDTLLEWVRQGCP